MFTWLGILSISPNTRSCPVNIGKTGVTEIHGLLIRNFKTYFKMATWHIFSKSMWKGLTETVGGIRFEETFRNNCSEFFYLTQRHWQPTSCALFFCCFFVDIQILTKWWHVIARLNMYATHKLCCFSFSCRYWDSILYFEQTSFPVP